jgi:hypothetical protein
MSIGASFGSFSDSHLKAFKSIGVFLSSSSYTNMIKIKRDENISGIISYGSTCLRQQKNETVVQNNNFTLAFKTRMMI